nr:DeoR/GlpR family DNA-binding transcription regulator [uncultured Cohaesibacter sp.]
MTSSKKQTRQKRIVDELAFQPSLRVADLADKLHVSSETIRRDLDELTKQGLIGRTYGGAVARRSMQEPGLNERHNLLVEERQRIAKAAIPALAGSKHFMIGSGATTMQVARRMAFEMNNITVLTHAFGIATALSMNPTIKVFMAPGRYYAKEGAMHGGQTIRFLQTFRADWAILGASGLDEEGGTDAVIDAGEVYATMIQRATRTMVVADHSKYGESFAAQYATWKSIDVLVSDQAPPTRLATAINEAGVRLVTAPQ